MSTDRDHYDWTCRQGVDVMFDTGRVEVMRCLDGRSFRVRLVASTDPYAIANSTVINC